MDFFINAAFNTEYTACRSTAAAAATRLDLIVVLFNNNNTWKPLRTICVAQEFIRCSDVVTEKE